MKQWKKRSNEHVQSITLWLWNMVSNKLRIKCTEQQHQE